MFVSGEITTKTWSWISYKEKALTKIEYMGALHKIKIEMYATNFAIQPGGECSGGERSISHVKHYMYRLSRNRHQ